MRTQITMVQPGAKGADFVALNDAVKRYLLDNGCTFAHMYVARRSSIGKIARPEWVQWCHEHGIAVVFDYEGNAGDVLAGAVGGVANGAFTAQFCRNFPYGGGYPAGATLLCSADTDVYAGNIGSASAYVRGFAGQTTAWQPGTYGDPDILLAVKDLHPVGWHANAWKHTDPTTGRPLTPAQLIAAGVPTHVMQGRTLGVVDPNTCVTAFPAWLPHDVTAPPPEIKPPPHQEDDMPRFIRPNDNDAAVFLLSGVTCTWVPSSAVAAQAVKDGLAVDQTYHPVSRSSLKLLRLWGPAPQYPTGYNGPVTTAADFGSAA